MQNPNEGRATIFGRWMRFADAARKTEGLWFIFAILLATGFALALTPQGTDLVRAVVEDGANAKSLSQWVPSIMLHVSAVYLGLQAWFWARVVVEFQFGARERWASNLLLVWVPRLFGLMPFGFLMGLLRKAVRPPELKAP